MSTARVGLPRTTAWAVVAVAALGLAALAVTLPVLGAGALAGIAVGVAVRGLDRSPRWTAVATAALPLGVFGVVVALGLAGSFRATLVTLAAVVVGISLVSVVAGRLAAQQIELVGASAAVSVLALVPAAVLTAEVVPSGGPGAVTRELLWFSGSGTTGFLTWLLLAGGVTTAAAAVLPSALATNLQGQPLELREGEFRGPAVAVGGTVVLFVLFVVGQALSGTRPVVESVAASGVARGVVAGIAVLAAVVGCLAVLARLVWNGSRTLPAVALGVGGLLGAVAVSLLAAAVTAESGVALSVTFVPTILGVVATGVGAALLADRVALEEWLASVEIEETLTGDAASPARYRFRKDNYRGWGNTRSTAPAPPEPLLSLSLPRGVLLRADTLVPAGLVAGAVLVALGMDASLALDQVGVVVAIGSALVAHALVARGRAATRDVGVGNVRALPQFIWLGWTTALTTLGVGVAVGGILLSGRLATPLSVPATGGVAFGLVALVAGVWLLFR